MNKKDLMQAINLAAETGATTLNLSANKLSSIPTEIGKIKSLEVLDLSNNKLSALPTTVGDLSNLKTLDIRSNQIKDLPENIYKLVRLTNLLISGNLLEDLSSEIKNLKKLKTLIIGDMFGGNKIEVLPHEIGELGDLVNLLVSDNLLKNLPEEIGNLRYLRSLFAHRNKIASLPSSIGDLKHVESLYFDDNQLDSLPVEFGKLLNLKHLDVSKNFFHTLPDQICNLRKLETLSVSHNFIKEFPKHFSLLKSLREIYANNNRLTELPADIGELSSLKILTLRNKKPQDFSFRISSERVIENQIKSLPLSIQNLRKLTTFDIEGSPIGIPPEILKNSTPSEVIRYYFTGIKTGTKPLNEIKVLLTGQGSVGKTSLVQQILSGTFNKNQPKTDGIAISQWQSSEKEKEKNKSKSKAKNSYSQIQVNIWDFGGQEIMHATHQFFLTKRSLYLLVLDSRLTQEENRVEYWLKIIQSFSDESPVLIVGNKTDQHPLDIDRTGLQKKYPNIVGILETSAATGAGIEELKAAITEQVNNLPHVRDLLPETWFTVKTKLEGLGRESNFITHDKYLELCGENEVNDETSQRTLIGFLHDLGVVLHFQDDPRLEALGILNPQWVTNGVYKILNSHTLFQNKGVLTTNMLDEILNLPEYPRGKRLFIVDMMKKFELCYEMPYGYDIEPDKTFLVPDLLPKDEPAELKFNGVPAFEYAYPVLPSSVITRFIVRMNQKIENHFVWRTGVVLKIGENLALVKADIEDRKITIAIDGVEHTRRDALSAIRYQLDEIHGSIKGLDAQKRVPIPEAPSAEPLDYDYLLQLERDGELEILPVKDGSRLVKVNVRKLLSGVVSETERRQSAGNTTNIYIGGDVKGGTIIAGDENEVNKK